MSTRLLKYRVEDPEGYDPVDIQRPQPNRSNRLRLHQIANPRPVSDQPAVQAAPGDLKHYRAALDADRVLLKSARTIEEKAELKRGFLPKYMTFVNDYIDSGHTYPNSVALWVAIWCLDAGDIEQGLKIGFAMARMKNQPTPKEFGRDLPTILCDSVYDWAAEQLRNGQPASPYLDELARAVETEGWDLHPAVASKTYAMLAKHKFRTHEYAETVALCERAQQVNPEGAGVKTLMANARAKLV